MPDNETLAVGVNSRGAVVGAKKYNKALNSMGVATNKTGGVMKKFGGAIAGVFAGLTAAVAIKKTISTISAFEDSMAELRGVTQATAGEMKQFSDTAREMGATTRFSATQAADGLLALSRAGFSAKESTTAIASTLQLATAGNLELGRSSEIVSNTIRQFGLEASEAGRVTDVLVNTANKANTDVNGLAESMKFAGVMAGQFGVPLEETTAVLGQLANVGLKGGIAGRNLAQVMGTLAAPTDQAKQALYDLGLTMDQVNPEKVGIIGAMEALQKANADTTALTKIFSKAQLKVVLPLVKSTEAVKDLTKANEESNGVAEKNAKLMENTLSGAFLELKSSLEAVMLSAGDTGFLGALKEIIRFSTSVIRSIFGIGKSSSETFLKMQIAVNKAMKFWKIFFTKSMAGWKLVWETVKWVGAKIKEFFKGVANRVIADMSRMASGLLEGIARVIEAMEKPASFVSQDLTVGLKEARNAVRGFGTDMRDTLYEMKAEENDVKGLRERSLEVIKDTEQKVKDIETAHTGVHSKLVKELNELKKQNAELKKMKENANGVKVDTKKPVDYDSRMEAEYAGSPAVLPSYDYEKEIKMRATVNDALEKTWEIDNKIMDIFKRASGAMGEIGNKAVEATTKVVNSVETMTEKSNKMKIAWRDIGQTISGTLTDAILKTRDWGGALRDISDQLVRMAVQRAIMAGFSGGGDVPTGAKGLVAMASGGVVSGPTPALIGERGPEAVIPLKRGENGVLGLESSGTQVVNNHMTIISPDARGVKDMLLRDPKLIRQMNETYKQGYAID